MTTATPATTVAFVARLVAKPDTGDEVAAFLADAVRLANDERGTTVWFALRSDPTTFWIVDAFPAEADRQAHITGPIAAALGVTTIRLEPELRGRDIDHATGYQGD